MTKSSILLGVNIDHVAFIKKSRETSYPDLIQAVKVVKIQVPTQLRFI